MRSFIPVFLASTLLSSALYADNYAPREGRFIDRDTEGWFFYEEPVEETKLAEKPPAPPEKPEQVETIELPEANPQPVVVVQQGPKPLSAEWFRENLQKYRDMAVDNPTPENVATYMYLQSYALDKASMFSDMAEQVVISNPALDENTRRPLATFASQAVDREAKENKNAILTELADKYGVWFFYDSATIYTTKQADTLKMLEREHGFTILPISLDGTPPPEGTFEKFNIDDGHSKKLNIITAPAVYLVDPKTKQFALVGQGVMSRPELHRRMLITSQQHGFITEEQFRSAKPMMNADYLLAETINSKELETMIPASEIGVDEAPNSFIPPEQFMQYIKSKISPHGGAK